MSFMKRRYTAIAICLLLLMAASHFVSCASNDIQDPIGEAISTDPVLIALEAYAGSDQYFLRYQRADEVYYAAGDLRRIRVDTTVERAGYDTPVLLDMEEEAATPWRELTRSMRPIPILGIADWAAFRDRIFGQILSPTAETGVVVSADRMDYFFFYDRAGRFRARRFIDKPAEYAVAARVDLRDYFEQWQPLLTRFLMERGIDANEVLFNTGDLEAGAIPFIYVNTRTRVIVLVRYEELPDLPGTGLPASHVLQSFWHFIESHTYSVPMRPFSSVQSLLALVSDTAADAGRNLLPDVPPPAAVPPLSDRPPMDLVAWERYLEQRLGRPATRGKLDFLVGGTAFFTRFIDSVTSAADSVDIRAYIFDNDDVAMEIAELLKRRSSEGVAVRVLYDGLGSIIAGGEDSISLPENHRAPFSMEAYLQQGTSVKVRKVKNTWLRGDHVKTMIIDQRVAFLGGMNIGREYRYDWHDLMVEMTGPVVDRIMEEFESAWAHAGVFGDFGMLAQRGGANANEAAGGAPLRLISTGPASREIFDLQREAIRRSQSYIYVENAYFTDDVLLRELILARRRGVDVRVIIPLETDSGLITRNIAFAANHLYQNGVRVFIYPEFTHAKAAIFDGWASVGTANLDRLSLKINREINIASSHPGTVDELQAELFDPDFQRSVEMHEPFPSRWTDHLIEMMGDYVF